MWHSSKKLYPVGCGSCETRHDVHMSPGGEDEVRSEVFNTREGSTIVEFQLRALGASHGCRNTKVQPAP